MKPWLIHFAIGGVLILAHTGCKSLPGLSSVTSMFGGSGGDDATGFDQDEILDPLGARDGNRLLLEDFSPAQIATTLKIRASSEENEKAAKDYFSKGRTHYNEATRTLEADPKGNEHFAIFVDAANQFRLAASSFPDSKIAEDALYFEGESYFFADRYVQANRAFEKLIANYSGTQHLDMAENRRFAISVYWLQLSETASPYSLYDSKRPKSNLAGEARRVLHQIRIDDPTGKLADDATMALGKAFLNAKRYYEAADTFEDLRLNYVRSKHQFTAHMLELEARLAGYQGKDYDDTPLLKADELMKSIVRQFPNEANSQLEFIDEKASLIQNQIAERDYAMAKYYESRGENRAAQMYYQKVADKYKNTDLGAVVKQRIEEVSNKPAKPKQAMEWLVNLFPNPEPEKPVIISGDTSSIFN